MNRAEARIKNFQYSNSQIKASNDMCAKNDNFWLKLESNMNAANMARKLGRKKKKRG